MGPDLRDERTGDLHVCGDTDGDTEGTEKLQPEWIGAGGRKIDTARDGTDASSHSLMCSSVRRRYMPIADMLRLPVLLLIYVS